MKYIPRIGIAILLALGAPFQTSPAQDEPRTCRSLDQKTALMFVPDLDTSSPAVLVSLTPQGEKEFELRMGRYVVRGAQR